MKNVGILTFHYADNYGAVLQTYALRSTINSFPGCRAEVINFVPAGFSYPLYKNNEQSYRGLVKKRELFGKFLKEKCGVDGECISSVTGNDYDYYCVGSDQVWNLRFADAEYLLPNLDENAIRISYAASVGMAKEEVLNFREIFRKNLPKFKAISLREYAQKDIIENISQKKCHVVVDPTLLLKSEDYTSLISQRRLRDKPFILFFWLHHDGELMGGVEFVNTLSRKYHLPIVHTVIDAKPYVFNEDGGCMIYEGIDSFLWYVKNAEFVVTNSYHALLFSIQFKKPFYVFVVESMRSRIDTIAKKYGIEGRVVKTYVKPEDIDDNVDFLSIEEKIENERLQSIKFLRDSLDER